MGALKTILVAASLALATPAQAESVADWRPYIAEASTRFDVPVVWIEAVMQAESRGRTRLGGKLIRSTAGAMGLMQLMPATWADMRQRLGLGHDPDDPRDNILAGALYLRLMYDRFGYPGLFAAYNAGPGRYVAHLAGRQALPSETVRYLASVAPASPMPTMASTTNAQPSIFAVHKDAPIRSDGPVAPPASSLFVALSQGN